MAAIRECTARRVRRGRLQTEAIAFLTTAQTTVRNNLGANPVRITCTKV